MPDQIVPSATTNQELPELNLPVYKQTSNPEVAPDMGLNRPFETARTMNSLEPSGEDYARNISYGPSINDIINDLHNYEETMQGMIDNYGMMGAGGMAPGTGFNPQQGYSNFVKSINPSQPTMAALNKPMVVGPESGYKRYAQSEDYRAFGYTPSIGDEQEYKYGRDMSWGETVGKAFGGATRLAADTFIEGWKGWGRMADALASWDASKLMGTPEERYEMAQRQEDIMNKYAIYDTAESKDGIFNRQFFGNMLQQSGFAIGAGLQFAAEELLTFGLATAFEPLTKGMAIGRMLKATEKIEDLVNDTRKVMETVTSSEKVTNAFATAARKIVPLYGTAEDMVKLGKAGAGAFQLTMTGLGGVRRSLSEFNMARSESIFEAAGTYKRMTDNLTQEYKDKYGVDPVGDDLEKIKQYAEDASHDNFWTNVGVLSVMNRIQFDNMFKGFNTTRKIFNTEAANLEGKAFEVAGKIAGKEETRAFTTGTFGRLSAVGEISKTFGKKTAAWEATKSIGKGLMKWEGSEGLQELIQTASDQGLANYYSDLYHGAKGYGTKLDNVMQELYKERPWASTEGLKTFLMGALTGRLISPLSMLQERTLGRKEYKDKKAQAKEAVSNLNAFYSNPDNWLKESIANVKVQNKAAETMEEAAKNHNKYVFNNYKDSAFGKAVASAIKLNMYESMRDTIKEYGATMSNDEFKQAFGIEATPQNKKDVKAFMGEIVDQMEEYHTTYQNLKDKYADKILPELYKNNKPADYLQMTIAKKAVDDAIETLTTNVHKAKQAVKRASGLQSEISSNPNIGSSSIQVLTKMGSEINLQKNIDMLEDEIKTTEAASKDVPLTPEAIKLLNEKKEELKLAKKWQQSYADLLVNTDESFSPTTEGRAYEAFAQLVNLYNKKANNTTAISKEDVDDVFIKFHDYIRLNADNKSYVDAMNLLADPRNMTLVAEAMQSAIRGVQEEFKTEQEEEIKKESGEETKKEETPVTPKKSTIIKTTDKDGKVIDLEIVEGESYITEASPERRIYKGKTPTTVYNQDILKIVSINDNGSISFTYNNEGEAITMTPEEFAEIGKLYPLSKMTVPQRIYFRNRDIVFDLNVYKQTGRPHYNRGKYANKDFTSVGINVKARFELVKEGDEYVLKITYINPVTKLKESIDYDAAYLKKYAGNKKDLFDITESEQDVLNRRTEGRRVLQIKMLNEALQNIVPNREKLLADRNKNEEDYNKVKKELEDYVAEMELIEERFKVKPYTKGRKSAERVELEARQEVLRNLIKNAEDLIERFQTQATDIEKQLDTLNQLSDYYAQGIAELEETGQPYSMEEGKIYGAEEQKLKEVQAQQIIKPSRNISTDDINNLVDDTQAELDLVNERISSLQKIVDYSNKILNRILKVTDLFDTLSNITDQRQLLNQLVLMKRQETDSENKQTIQNLINLVNKGNSLELAYVYETMDRLGDAKEEIKNLLEDARNLQDKYDRLSLAKQQRADMSALEYRLDMLKAIQEELLKQYAAAREKAGVKQEGEKIIVKNNSTPIEDDLIKGPDALFVTEPILDIVPGSEDEADTFRTMETFTPVLDENALYKTAGRHFQDRNDTVLASPQDARFFKFSETAKLSDENGVVYYLMPITKDSKEFQDIRFKDYADDIRLVVVKRDDSGVFKPVGMDGNILETPTKDNMVYIGMHGGPELMSDDNDTVYKWLSDNFAIHDKRTGKDRVNKEQALAIANSFKQTREAIKEKVKAGEKVVLPIVDKSPGVYNREPLTGGYDENGNPVPQRPQELSLEGRLIEDKPDFTNLRHPDGRPTKLEVSINNSRVKAGRVMMTRLGEPGIVVYNRKFTEAEHENIINILKRMSELFAQKLTKDGLNEEQNIEFTNGIKFLQGVTFWNPIQEGKEPYSFQLTVKNGLHIGKEVISFTPDSIEQNKDKIKQAIEYHKINNRFLNDKLKDEPFYDVKAIDGKIIRGKQYVNYQHYLLADRPGGAILYTNIKPYTAASEDKLNPQNYQLKNVYFKYDASTYITEPIQQPGDDGTITPDTQGIKQYSINQVEKVINGVKFFSIENNIPKEGKVTFVTKRQNGQDLYLHTEYKDGKYEIFQIIDEKGNDLTNAEVKDKTAKEQYQSGLTRSIDKQLEMLKDNEDVPGADRGFQSDVIKSFRDTFPRVEEYAKQGEVMNDIKAAEVVTAPVAPVVTTPTQTTPVVTPSTANKTYDDYVDEEYKRHVNNMKSNGNTPLSKQEFINKFSKSLELQYKTRKQYTAADLLQMAQQAQGDDYDANARVADATTSGKVEDVEKFKEWMKENLPQIPVQIFDELIDGKYLGQFINGMIRMYRFAEEGTGFHEAFEAVWNSYLSPERQAALIQEYKNRPDYKSLPAYQWAEARYKTTNEDKIIKEALAEEFREYMLTDAATVKAESPKRNTFFRKIWNFIKKLLGLSKEQKNEMESKANELFSEIAKGKFKNAEPVQNYDPSAAHNRAAISGTSVEFTQQLMEGMTAIFFSKLNNEVYRAKGYSIEKMFDEDNNIFEELFNDTWKTLFNRFMPGLNQVMSRDEFKYASPEVQQDFLKQYTENRIAQDEKISSNLYYQKMTAVNKQTYNTEVRKQFKDYLSQFGLKFRQVEDAKKSEEEIAEIEGKEEQANGLGVRDVIYIDPTSLTNPTVRLLILSLPNNKQDESGRVSEVVNKLNLPSLVSYKRKMNVLLNELSDIVPMMRKQADGTFKKTSALEEMFTKLDKKFKDPIYKAKYKDEYEWVGKLKARLKVDTLTSGGILSNDEMKLLVAFETSFTRNKNNPLKIIVGADGRIRHVNAVSVNTIEKIREEWRNAIKETAHKVDISKLDTGGILYVNPANRIEVNLSSPRIKFVTGASDIRGYLAAFNALGITLSTTPEKLSETDKNTIKLAYNSLKYVIEDNIKNNKPLNYDDLFGSNLIAGPLNSLLALELNYRSEDTLLSHQTAEGKTQYAITLPSEISYVVHSLNSANSLEEFIMSNPQYGKIVNGVITLNPYNASSEMLTPGGLIFDNKGRKRDGAKIEYEYISGMAADKESGGDNTDRLTFNDKIVQEIYHILRGSYFTVINSDKSSEFAVKMGHFVKMRDISDMNIIEDKYVAALRGEVMHALRFHFFPNNIQYHQKNILMLGHFSGILGFTKEGKQGPLQQYFNKLVGDIKISKKTKLEDASMIFESIADNFTSVVKNQGIIKDYVDAQVEDVKSWLISKEIVKPTQIKSFGAVYDRYKALGIPRDADVILGINTSEMGEVELTQIARFLTVNRQLGVFEQHKLFYGHPALYKDLAKRANGANSQKNVVSENPHVISWMEQNKPRYDGRKRDAQNPFVRNISYADPLSTSVHVKYIAEELYKGIAKRVSKAKAEQLVGAKFDDKGNLVSIQASKGSYISGYINMQEADAQAGIMPDYFRDLMYLSGSLSKEQEALLDWEHASEVIDRSNKNHPYYNPAYTAEQIAKAKEILKEPKPEAILQVLKPQGFGFQNTDGMAHIDFLKNSVLPLTWSRVKNNPDMMSKYINAQNQGVDVIGFGSGHKVGLVTNKNGSLTPFYNEDGSISTETPVLQDIYSKYVGIQVQTPDYAKNKVIFGSQVRKLILSDLPDSLKPYAQEYKDVLNKLLDLERQDLLNELGLKLKDDGSYEVEDVSRLMETLRQEAIKRTLPDNIVEMLDTFIIDNKNVPKYPLDANPARERIESVLNSIVDNRIIRTEMFGKANVQVASAFFSQGRKLLYLKDGMYEKVDDFSKLSDKEKKSTVLASTDLNFYNKEKPYMEVYTPWYFKGITPQEAGFVQNKEGMWVAPEGSDVAKLLNSIGFRIPTQGLNSIDSIVIKGFLDPSYGDMVVVPSEMVGKSGSDFDIDKLNMFLANYHIEIEKLSFEDLQEFKSFYSYDNLPKYIREWFNGLSKQESDDFIDDLNKFSVTSGLGEFGNLSDWLKENNITGSQAEIYESFKLALVEYNQHKRDLLKRNKAEAGKVRAKKIVYIDPANNTSKKGLQNRVLEIMKTIVEHPDNQRQLLTPNSSAKLKALSEHILKLKGIVKTEDDMTKLSEWKTMSETRETFITSKQLVGVGALQITSHAMSQIGDVELTGTYKDFDGTVREVKIKLPNSNTNKLNLTIDQDGMYIFDLFNEALTGSVDAAKDPFIFDIRLNLETAGTWFYLTKRGVSQENIALMFNQPIMDDYFRIRDANDTYINDVNDEKDYYTDTIIKAISPYYTAATGKVIEDSYNAKLQALASFRAIQDEFKNYSNKDLSDAISTKSLSKQQNLMQVAILMDMLDYKEQASKLSNFVRAISYDTTKTKNLVENYLQRARYNISMNDEFITKDSIDRVFNNTFLGKVKEAKEDVLKMFENFFVVLNPKSLPAFAPILEKFDDDKLFMTNDDKADLLNRYQNFFLTHVLQNTTFGNNQKLSQYYNLFSDGREESLAKRLKKMKAKYPESAALKNLYPLINQNRNSTDNIKMFNNKMSSYDINSISESIDILHTQAEMTGDLELKEFIDNLARFAILQSGVQLSPITFTKVLPIDLYAGLTGDIFKNYAASATPVNVEQIWKAFHQNNWKNNKIVPTLKASGKKRRAIKSQNDGTIVLKRNDRNVKNQYLKMYDPIEGVDMKDTKIPFDQKFKVSLYERVKVTDATGRDITLDRSAVKYRPINKLGNGMYLMETTPDPLTNASRFDINGDVNEGMFDATVNAWKQLLSTDELTTSDRPEFDKLPFKSDTPTMTYAGIGSRQTPQEVLDRMTEVAKELERKGYTLNTGKTFGGKEEGADQAFSKGTTKKNLFAPEGASEREKAIAKEIHPNPDALSEGALKLQARNTNQVFGANLDTPVDFVLFYAKEVPGSIRPEGGTGQAVEMARRKGIPTINMAESDWREQLNRVLNAKPTQLSTSVQQKSLGNIKLNIIEDWVQSGQATTTVRSSTYHNSFYKGDGVYTTDKGNLVNITYRGLVKLQGDKVVGNNVSYTKDEFAKAEGFGTWENFKKGAKYAGKTLIDGGSVHLYDIKPTQKSITLKDGKTYTGDQLSTQMLQNMGYSLEEAGEIIKNNKC